MAKRKEKLVFNGKLFKVYQWRQKMFDGSYATFERVVRPSSASVLAVANGRIAITRQSQPHMHNFIGLLGGRLDEGESPLQAAKRELLEESGMVAKKWRLLKGFARPSHKITFGVNLYAALECKKVREPRLDSGEKIRITWVTLKELLELREETARIGPNIALYFIERKYNPVLRRKFRKQLGL